MSLLRLVWSRTDVAEESASEAPSALSARALRLVWNEGPVGVAVQRTGSRGPTPLRMDLALAIDRHLKGVDGLTDEQFLRLFAHGLHARAREASPSSD